MKFELSLSDGSYTLGTRNTAFLKSSDTFFRADKTIYSLGDGSLKLTSQQLSMGSDAHGDYDVITNYYTAGNANVSTSFIIYQDVDVVVFNQVSKNKQHSRPHIEFAKINPVILYDRSWLSFEYQSVIF